MTVKLSSRLTEIARHVPRGSVVADIGSDHALLPVYLVQTGLASYVIAGEVNPGPYATAKRQVARASLTERIDVRLGDGLSILRREDSSVPRQNIEVGVVTIAGMGGPLIVSILDCGQTQLASVNKLILQPNVGEEAVRRWLDAQGWELTSETILEEDDHLYEILVAERVGDSRQTIYSSGYTASGCFVDSQLRFKLGPYFIEQADPLWLRKWQIECNKWRVVLHQMRCSQTEESQRKSREIENEIQRMEEVLRCSQKDKR